MKDKRVIKIIHHHDTWWVQRSELNKAKREIKRLREALQEIESCGHSDLCKSMKEYRPNYICHVEVAEEALKGVK